MNQADTVWVLIATALVFFMTMPGLALFYGGLVRARNVLNMFMQCYAIACLMMLIWYVAGYSIAFGDESGFWGGAGSILLADVTLESQVGTIPEVLFFAFQMTFAIITPVIIVGACAERAKFGFMLLFSALWAVLVYAPIAHWVWGGGILSDGGILGERGARDYAGGLVVHLTSGTAALVLAVVIGPRLDRSGEPHNPGMVMIGAAMLWVGWLGFNGASGLQANANAAMALTVTMISAATASLTWLAWEYIKFGKCTLVGMVTGTLAGLASVTAAAGFVGPGYAIMMGAIAGVVCQELVYFLRDRLGIDDTLDVFAVHGVGGIYGSLMVAPLGITTYAAQLGAIGVVLGYSACVTLLIAFFCKGIVGIRVTPEEEQIGLDRRKSNQEAYDLTS